MQKTRQMNKKKETKVFTKIKKRLFLLIAVSPLLYLVFSIARWPIYNSLLDNHSKIKTGIIIDKKNILGKGVITQMYSYSYEFWANGKTYTGDSKKRRYRVGDKIYVEYLDYCPSISRLKQ
jgi:hypothetical protein